MMHSAKLDALIDRAAVMVVELASSWTMAEFQMALARLRNSQMGKGQRKSLRLILVVPNYDQVPASAQDWRILQRPDIVSGDPTGFLGDLGGTLAAIAEELGVQRQTEPQRLFDAKEYRAAVISAMTLLESKLRERLNKSQWPEVRRPLALRSLLDLAVEQQVIRPTVRQQIDGWMRVRNEAVHSAVAISRSQAQEIVDGVLGLIQQL